MKTEPRYNPLSAYLKEKFGAPARKISINAGFSCPTRDGSKGAGGCAYCNEAMLVKNPASMSVTEQIKCAVKGAPQGIKFIAYFQINTNTYDAPERLKALYNEAASNENIAGLAVSTRPDCLPDDTIKLLSEVNTKKPLWLELGLQSAKDSTLEAIGRAHTAAEFADAVKRAHKAGLKVCVHMILGLPQETRTDMLGTVRFISGLDVWGVKFHQLDVVRGTRMEDMYNEGLVRPLGVEEYADIVVESLEELSPDAVIHRLAGFTPKDILIAPAWSADKFAAKNAIERLLKAKNTRQGARCAR